MSNNPISDTIGLRDTTEIEWTILMDFAENNDALAELIPSIKPEYFTGTRVELWREIVSQFNDGSVTSVLTAISKPENKAHLEAYLARLSRRQGYVPVDEVARHTRLLREEAARRRCSYAAMRLVNLASGGDSEGEIYAKAAEILASVEDDTLKAEYSLWEVINNIADQVQKRKAERDAGRLPSIPTGFQDLDTMTDGGWKKGSLVILAARPSVGKTSIALQFARASAEAGFKTAIFSIEMTAEELGNRMLYSTDLVTSNEVWYGDMNWTNFEAATGKLGRLPILVNERARDISEIVSRLTILNRQHKCDIAFVDYLGLIRPDDLRIPLYQQIADITGTLKSVAKRLGIPIILLCQLNREAAKNEKPQLYHLRDSGSIEQDADIVLMLAETEGEGDTPDIQMYIRKNRHGQRNVYIQLRPNETRSAYREVECGKD